MAIRNVLRRIWIVWLRFEYRADAVLLVVDGVLGMLIGFLSGNPVYDVGSLAAPAAAPWLWAFGSAIR